MPPPDAAPAGLTTREAKQKLAKFGPNEIVQTKKLSGLFAFLLKFRNPLVFILVFAALVSGFFGDWASATIIILIVLLSVILDFVNTYKSHKAAEALKARVMITAKTLRDGVWAELHLANLVPGDVVELLAGDVVPADGAVASAQDFFLNESPLTGESLPVEKAVGDEVFLGTSAVAGSAVMEVRQTGAATKLSKIAGELNRKQITDFDRGIKDFSYLIMKITFALVILIFLVNALLKGSVLQSFLFAAALAVGLTPELLPMIITLNLSKGSLQMSRHGVIVKNLSAIQNFGAMDVLCTDKTGTLTEDKIVLVKYVDAKDQPSQQVLEAAYLTSSFRSGLANPLDAAIRDFKTLDISAYRKIDEAPFDYFRKRDSIVVEKQGKRLLIAKGAPEELFKVSASYGGPAQKLTPNVLGLLEDEYRKLSADGFRVLGVAQRFVSAAVDSYGKELEKDMVFLGFVAFLDPPKKTVAETLQRLERHGIRIKIITGDNRLVTQKIAADIHLPIQDVLVGSEIEELTERQLRAAVEHTTIFARVPPEQKRRIILALQKNGHAVGYLGDGINDAPSLEAADVGISVNNAVDVAKEAADLILLHKSLAELVDGVVQGRKTFTNTMKYLMMALSSNFGNMFSMAAASLFLPFLPMLPSQILFNNLLYDTSQFAIPLDNVDEDDIQLPRKLSIHFLRKFMLIFGPLSSVFDFLTFFLLLYAFHLAGQRFQTGWFLESLTTQTLVVYAIRTKWFFGKSVPSRAVVYSTTGVVIIGWVMGQSFLGKLLHFTPLPAAVLGSLVLVTLLYLFSVEWAKAKFYKKVAS